MEINPPSYLEDGCYTAQQDRLILSTLICGAGVKNAGGVGTDLRVGSTSTAPLTILVGSGSGFVQGDVIANQGMYHVVNDSQITLTLDPPDLTDTRIDMVVARVYDSQYLGSEDRWALEVVTGDPSPSPALPDLPPNSLPLAAVTVDPGLVNTSPGIIQDLRETFELCGPPEPTVQAGSALVTASNGIGTTAVNFPVPFAGVPTVVASPESGANVQLSASVTSISETGCTLVLRRGNSTSTRVHYVAVYMPT